MPLPDRPVDDAEVATDWGQEIHDRVFAPKGGAFGGGSTAITNASIVKLPLDAGGGTNDPGGWLDAANDRLVVPAGAEGIYPAWAHVGASGGTTGDAIRAYIYVNGSEVARNTEDLLTGIAIRNTISSPLILTAGDVITVHAIQRGSAGAGHNANVTALYLLRHGADFGA